MDINTKVRDPKLYYFCKILSWSVFFFYLTLFGCLFGLIVYCYTILSNYGYRITKYLYEFLLSQILSKKKNTCIISIIFYYFEKITK